MKREAVHLLIFVATWIAAPLLCVLLVVFELYMHKHSMEAISGHPISWWNA